MPDDEVNKIYLCNIKGPPGNAGEIATVAKVGVVKPDGDTIVITEDGTISSTAKGGGGAAGPMNFEVRSDGHLYVVYDDGMGEPQIRINEQGHLVWSYETKE